MLYFLCTLIRPSGRNIKIKLTTGMTGTLLATINPKKVPGWNEKVGYICYALSSRQIGAASKFSRPLRWQLHSMLQSLLKKVNGWNWEKKNYMLYLICTLIRPSRHNIKIKLTTGMTDTLLTTITPKKGATRMTRYNKITTVFFFK